MKRIILLATLLLFPALALAVTVDASTVSYDMMADATNKIATNLQKVGIKLFFALTVLQLVITGYGQVAAGEIEATLGKFTKAMIWISFCLYLMINNTASNFVGNTVQYFLGHAIGWATNNTGVEFNVNGIVLTGINAMGSVVQAISKAETPTSDAGGFLTYFIPDGSLFSAIYGAIITGIIVIIVMATCGYIALKVFMIKIEAALVLAVLPLSLAFLGLNAMRDQGFAPFKSMLALIYRIVILGAIVGGLESVGQSVMSIATSSTSPSILEVSLTAVFGFVILAFLAHKSDSIASSLANGSANLGSGDAVGAAMAAGAAAAVVMTGGAAAAAAGGAKASQSMGETMKGLTGGGSISNASSKGAGSTPEPAPSKPSASMSGTSSDGGSPKREVAGNAFSEKGGMSNKTSTDTSNGKSTSPAPAAPSSGSDGKGPATPSGAAAPAATAKKTGSDSVVSAAQPSGSEASKADATPSGGAGRANEEGPSAAAPKREDFAGPGTETSPTGGAGSGAAAPAATAEKTGSDSVVSAAQPSGSGTSSATPPGGAGVNAGVAQIGGNLSELEKKVDQRGQHLGAPRKANFQERLKDVGHHVAQEKGTATHVSINTNERD